MHGLSVLTHKRGVVKSDLHSPSLQSVGISIGSAMLITVCGWWRVCSKRAANFDFVFVRNNGRSIRTLIELGQALSE